MLQKYSYIVIYVYICVHILSIYVTDLVTELVHPLPLSGFPFFFPLPEVRPADFGVHRAAGAKRSQEFITFKFLGETILVVNEQLQDFFGPVHSIGSEP